MNLLTEKFYIDGKWVESDSGKTVTIINPANGQILANVHQASKEQIKQAIAAADKAFKETWGPMPAIQRSRIMHKIANLINENIEGLSAIETNNVGKPIIESRNVDIPGAADTFEFFANVSVDILGNTIPSPFGNAVMDYTIREPLGVIGAITPWNFPLLLAARKIATSIAAGNTIVIKPASLTPLSTLALGKIFDAAGLPAGVVNIVTASGRDIGEAFASSTTIHEVTFTGSTSTGTELMRQCASSRIPCTLELGGKSPAVICEDCDVEEAVAGTLFGVFINQGECCCGLTRLIVHQNVYDEFTSKFVSAAKKIRVGNPMDEKTQMGPVVDAGHLETVMEYIDSGKSQGATLACGGIRLAGDEFAKGFFVEPTVFTNVTPDMRIWREEIFGPVVTITKAKDNDELIELANDTDYGLAASIWTKNLKTAHWMSAKIEAGTVWFNLHNFLFPAAPYCGFKASGVGGELGKQSLIAMTKTKNVMINLMQDTFKWY
ncbi:MAG TPA: aldehyde dehydrogenase family protein [Phycisphaerae bacterium]|nr:aldehyde dehydrogenase family protein [Phycisphaerae bacterium]